MKEYIVTVEVTLKKEVRVVAEDPRMAWETARDQVKSDIEFNDEFFADYSMLNPGWVPLTENLEMIDLDLVDEINR